VHTFYRAEKYAELYVSHILCLHGVLKTIISDQGPYFVACFWEQLHASLGTRLIHSSAYHPQTNGQTERVNQILEDILRACVLNYPDNWDKCLPLIEFSYNNGYQESHNGTLRSFVWPQLPYTCELYQAWRKDHLWP
jgi:transposase InsO family protein